MLNFRSTSSNPLFDYVCKVVANYPPPFEDGTAGDPKFEYSTLYARLPEIPEKMNKYIGTFAFPYPRKLLPEGGEQPFFFNSTDADRTFTFYWVHALCKEGIQHAYVVASRFYHPDFFAELIDKIAHEEPLDLTKMATLPTVKMPYDWYLKIDDPKMFKNFDHLSPSNESNKLLQFVFQRLSYHDILLTIAAMTLECPILIISSNINFLGKTAMALLSMISPVKWQGTFIPVLPQSMITTIEAPFPFIIGLHSSLCEHLLSGNVAEYFLINIDTHSVAVVGMEDFPQTIIEQINESGECIKRELHNHRPIFPSARIVLELQKFFLAILSRSFEIKGSSSKELIDKANYNRAIVSDSLPARLSQTQIINSFIRSLEEDTTLDIIHIYWPMEVVQMHRATLTSRRISAQRRDSDKTAARPVVALRENKANRQTLIDSVFKRDTSALTFSSGPKKSNCDLPQLFDVSLFSHAPADFEEQVTKELKKEKEKQKEKEKKKKHKHKHKHKHKLVASQKVFQSNPAPTVIPCVKCATDPKIDLDSIIIMPPSEASSENEDQIIAMD